MFKMGRLPRNTSVLILFLLSAGRVSAGSEALRTPVDSPTPVAKAAAQLPAPQWTHPPDRAIEYKVYLKDILDQKFLDWADVNGASAYKYSLTIVPEIKPTQYEHSYRIPETETPPAPNATPPSNSKIYPSHIHYTQMYADKDRYHFTVKIVAVDGSEPPVEGVWSEERKFVLEIPPTPTPEPTCEPTPDIDLDDRNGVDPVDWFVFQRSWDTFLATDSTYNPKADLDRDNDVDDTDLLAFENEMDRQRIPFQAPILVYPQADGDVAREDLSGSAGVTFVWETLPDTLGGTAYVLEIYGPVIRGATQGSGQLPDPIINYRSDTIRDTSLSVVVDTSGFDPVYPWFEWRVWAISPCDVKPLGIPAVRYIRLFNRGQ